MRIEFLNDARGRPRDWRLSNWTAAIRLVLGNRTALVFQAAFAAVLTPSLVLACYSLYANRPVLLINVLLSLWGFWTSSTRPTGIGMIFSMAIALSGLVSSFILQDRGLAFVCSLLPGATWLTSCAILGTTAQYLSEELRASEEKLEALVSRGVLIETAVSEPSDLGDTSS